MSLFSKNKNSTIAELEEYYENQRKNRSGRAWAMALISLIITVGVITGLFYGGRWTYKALTNNDTKTTTVIGGDKLPDGQSTENVTTTDVEPEGVVSDSAASTSKPITTIVDSTQSDLVSQSGPIPSTGPSSHTAGLLLFFAVAGGYAIARKRELNNL